LKTTTKIEEKILATPMEIILKTPISQTWREISRDPESDGAQILAQLIQPMDIQSFAETGVETVSIRSTDGRVFGYTFS